MPAKAPVAQIQAIVRNPQKGVKPDELKRTDLDAWLATQKGTVSKEAVLDYLRANAVRVQEIERGRRPVSEAKRGATQAALEDALARARAAETVKEGDMVANRGQRPIPGRLQLLHRGSTTRPGGRRTGGSAGSSTRNLAGRGRGGGLGVDRAPPAAAEGNRDPAEIRAIHHARRRKLPRAAADAAQQAGHSEVDGSRVSGGPASHRFTPSGSAFWPLWTDREVLTNSPGSEQRSASPAAGHLRSARPPNKFDAWIALPELITHSHCAFAALS